MGTVREDGEGTAGDHGHARCRPFTNGPWRAQPFSNSVLRDQRGLAEYEGEGGLPISTGSARMIANGHHCNPDCGGPHGLAGVKNATVTDVTWSKNIDLPPAEQAEPRTFPRPITNDVSTSGTRRRLDCNLCQDPKGRFRIRKSTSGGMDVRRTQELEVET